MRIAHVVTYVSDDGAFGGPVSVATQTVAELARRGHDVTLYAGWDGRYPLRVPGVDIRLYRARQYVHGAGFAGLVAPGLVRCLQASIGSYDVAHVHLARDLITLSAARIAFGKRVPVVTQTHGMVRPDSRVRARVTDWVATRSILRRAAIQTYLTEDESVALNAVAGSHEQRLPLRNGVGLPVTGGDRERIVLFCARLHPRKRVMAFADAAAQLLDAGLDVRFVVAGPDEGDLPKLLRFIADRGISDRLEYVGALSPQSVQDWLRRCAVFVLPSEREPFPMTLLESLALATPSVITTGCMIACELERSGAAIVTDGTPRQLAAAINGVLEDRIRADALGVRAREVVRESFSISSVVDQLETYYAKARRRQG